MRPIEAIVLGIVQGISEFLPISSSAHLILTSTFLGWRDQGLAFDMAANTGSLVAVMVYLRRELSQIALGLGNWLAAERTDRRHRYAAARPAMLLAVATIPVGIAGLAGRDLVAEIGRDPLLIAATSIGFGLLLWWADSRPQGERFLSDISLRIALLVGLAQALALVPGTSRAGVTLTVALLLGLNRPTAVRFTFLLAVPVGLLVAVKQAGELIVERPAVGGADGVSLAIGMLVAGISAYAAIAWLIAWVRRQNLLVFVVYRLLLGAVILASLAL